MACPRTSAGPESLGTVLRERTVPTTATPSADDPGLAVVTFRLSAEVKAESVSVVGEFNGWSRTAMLMRVTPDGFEATATIPYGKAYRFRYLIDGHRWENDWAADSYVPNEHGGDDSVVDLTAQPIRAPGEPRHPTADPRSRDTGAQRRPRPVRIWQ
jgi:1,4-alpha-glucan branching enzyme